MTDIYDLDAVAAEIRKDSLPFRYGGREWLMRHPSDCDWRVVHDAAAGNIESVQVAMKAALGDQYDDFNQLPQPIGVMTALFDRWLQHGGLTVGESEGSTDSSASTAEPLKPVSDPTTESTSEPSSPEA